MDGGKACQVYVYCIFSFFLIFPFSFCLPFHLSFFLILKGSLSKSNTVSLSVRQLQSPAPWSGPSILSPTSWLFKRAKAQQCSFLNTQIHPSTNRETAVWQKSLSLSLSLTLSICLSLCLSLLFLTLDSHPSHYPPSSIDLIRPGSSLLSIFLHPSFSPI